MGLFIEESGYAEAKVHMEKDASFLACADTLESPVVHFYSWRHKSITYGHFIDPWSLLHQEKVSLHGFDVARRPTGGGLLFHYYDLSFSVIIPTYHPKLSLNVMENYFLINSAILYSIQDSVESIHGITMYPEKREEACATLRSLCMASPTKYDLMFHGYKVGGAAERRTKRGLLHQGSIFLAAPPWKEIETVLQQKELLQPMQAHSASLFKGQGEIESIEKLKTFLKQKIIYYLHAALQ